MWLWGRWVWFSCLTPGPMWWASICHGDRGEALKVQRAVWQVEVGGRAGGELTGEQPPLPPPPRPHQGPCLQNCSCSAGPPRRPVACPLARVWAASPAVGTERLAPHFSNTRWGHGSLPQGFMKKTALSRISPWRRRQKEGRAQRRWAGSEKVSGHRTAWTGCACAETDGVWCHVARWAGWLGSEREPGICSSEARARKELTTMHQESRDIRKTEPDLSVCAQRRVMQNWQLPRMGLEKRSQEAPGRWWWSGVASFKWVLFPCEGRAHLANLSMSLFRQWEQPPPSGGNRRADAELEEVGSRSIGLNARVDADPRVISEIHLVPLPAQITLVALSCRCRAVFSEGEIVLINPQVHFPWIRCLRSLFQMICGLWEIPHGQGILF